MESLKYKIAKSLMNSKNEYINSEIDFKDTLSYIYLPSILGKFKLFSIIQDLTLIWLASPLSKQLMNEILNNLFIKRSKENITNISLLLLDELMKNTDVKKEVNVTIYDEFSKLFQPLGLTIYYDDEIRKKFFLSENNHSLNWRISIDGTNMSKERLKDIRNLFNYYLFPKSSTLKIKNNLMSPIQFNGITINFFIPLETYNNIMRGTL